MDDNSKEIKLLKRQRKSLETIMKELDANTKAMSDVIRFMIEIDTEIRNRGGYDRKKKNS